jgi:hypothetical protein
MSSTTAPTPDPTAVSASAVPPDPRSDWTAEIEWRRHGGTGEFLVIARSAGAAAGVVVGQSGALEWPPSSPAAVHALSDAARRLETELAGAGWVPIAPGRTWYAKRFAWPNADPPADLAADRGSSHVALGGPFARTPPWPPEARNAWRCEIAWDAGWAESRFRALAYAPRTRRGRAIAQSGSFAWLLMRRSDAGCPEQRDAVQALEAELGAAGWEPLGRGREWYSTRFSRRHEQP